MFYQLCSNCFSLAPQFPFIVYPIRLLLLLVDNVELQLYTTKNTRSLAPSMLFQGHMWALTPFLLKSWKNSITLGRSKVSPKKFFGIRVPHPHLLMISQRKWNSKKNSSTKLVTSGCCSRSKAAWISINGVSMSSFNDTKSSGRAKFLMKLITLSGVDWFPVTGTL